MALRIRKSGEIYCAAKTEAKIGDTYIDDNLHYYLSVLTEAIRPSKTHDKDALWFWNISGDALSHYAHINFNEEVLRPRRKFKFYLPIESYIRLKKHEDKRKFIIECGKYEWELQQNLKALKNETKRR